MRLFSGHRACRRCVSFPSGQVVERTTRFRVFTWDDVDGNHRSETRQIVIVRDSDGVSREAYLRAR